jgi:hypothetical protein
MKEWQRKRTEDKARLKAMNKAMGGHEARLRAMYGDHDNTTRLSVAVEKENQNGKK